jgi:hypothetical protein
MTNSLRQCLLAAVLIAVLVPAPALASHEGGSQPAQPGQPAQQAQPVPTQGGAPQPTASAEEDDDGASGILVAGIVAGLVAIGGGLALVKTRQGSPRAASD